MHKVLAEILAGVIPHKPTRNRMRGMFRYGLLRAWRLRRQLARDHSVPRYGLSVCAIAKDEGPYFVEWLEWHLSQGVDHFYVYDNDSSDGTRDILAPYVGRGIVDYIAWPGYRRQIAAYDDCLDRFRLDSRWLAFIDLDEFIVPVTDPSIPAFLSRCDAFAAVEVNWLVYGSGGQLTRTPGTMMQRFKCHAPWAHRLNRMVKSIVNPRRVYNMIGCHEAARIDGHTADSHGTPVTRHFREREPQHDVIRINHYAVRSLEEFREKQARGRASGKLRSVADDYFAQYDLNDICDT